MSNQVGQLLALPRVSSEFPNIVDLFKYSDYFLAVWMVMTSGKDLSSGVENWNPVSLIV